MRNKYHWIIIEPLLYLVIYNTGGHDTKECVNKYMTMLIIKLNIEIIHQAPSFTNVLNLGVWAGLKPLLNKDIL